MTHLVKTAKWSAFGLLLFVAATTLQAQWTDGNVAGTITDATSAAVAGATIKILNQQTGHVNETQADAIGFYRVAHLQPGSYQVRVEAKGFKLSVVDNVAVNVNTTTRVDAKLQVGAVQEIVEVASRQDECPTEDFLALGDDSITVIGAVGPAAAQLRFMT